MNQTAPVLEVKKLSKQIGKRKIVEDITFEVQKGEIFGFLGPNGAGKTTTIRMLVGLIRPTEGMIQIGGYPLQDQFIEAISQVGCIVENPELYPYLTGRENLEHFARMMTGVTDEWIHEIIRLVELEERIDELVKTYSLGMRQRLGIAQALLGSPKILILDEPTNGLDPAGIRELRAFIRKLVHEQGISVFISSHILHEIQLMCDRVAIINKGKIVYTGPVRELVHEEETRIEWRLDPLQSGVQVLKELSFVRPVEQTEEHLYVYMPLDRIAEVNEQLTAKQIKVTGIRPVQATLEDLFLQLTGGETKS
ncbi:ABC-2 type transport system ATP-binding protein [Croceifilum oryzae]|uniref:ABC-2 type transport system ATP-binding protein n=1 Tax=Croceifilum oryzae TaxID=1553429 RepID=A0AAJ1WU07_9BACL|nr:ABC transporter ATP-binding protein [Croceifilum oryzae]MDQ0417536.1 ABC-2 type transport system ATP-binding protein [Croceifilum oryzae]